MIKYLISLLAICFCNSIYAQQNVGIGTTSPNASAILDLTSTNKGFLMPRMNTAQRDAIASPVVGLQIFNLDDQCIDTYDGTNWIKTCGLKVTATITDPGHPSPNSWTQKPIVGGGERFGAVGFSIGSKGYIGTGNNGFSPLNDFWEYDPAANTWSQKANFAGLARAQAVGFSIGSKGYVGLGATGTSFFGDFWEYNPGTNAWALKAGFAGTARYNAVGFSIGNKGYIGTGNNSVGTVSALNDFWEYDPATDAWAPKANFGGTARTDAVGFSIGSKGYIGTGNNNNGDYLNDFWEYNPATNAWAIKAGLAGTARGKAVGFSIGNKGYIGTGVSTSSNLNDFWEYDPTANAWAPKAGFAGVARRAAAGFSIGNKGYIGTGFDGSTIFNDFWEYMDNNVTGMTYSSNTVSTTGNTVSDGAWTLANGNVYNSNTGNVGIGTTVPSNKLTVTGNADFSGNVGIGTTNPGAKLVVNNSGAEAEATAVVNATGGGNLALRSYNNNAAWPANLKASSAIFTNSGRLNIGTLSASNLNFFANSGYDNPQLVLSSLGRVGINTSSPACPLDVKGSSFINFSNYAYLTFLPVNYVGYSSSPANEAISIQAENLIKAQAYVAVSDARIKQKIAVSNSGKDLAVLNQIKITDYTYIDKISLGNGVHKKVIAQEVEQVYPQAVSKSIGFIPHIYALATKLVCSNDKLIITLAKAHGLKTGDLVKWIDDKAVEQKSTVVNVISAVSFEITSSHCSDKVFVYGKQVDDFRAVDYEALSTLNISATQELYKMITDLKAENEKLKAENMASNKVVEALAKDIEKIKAQLGMYVKAPEK